MKIACFEVDPAEKKQLEKALKGHDITCFDHPLSEKDVEKIIDVEALIVFIYSKIDRTILDELPNVKYITTMSTGFDHIDLEVCKEKNIIISNVPSYGEVTVAEHTFALLLAVSRRLIESYTRVKSGYFSPQGLTGFDLNGKTMGVIGVGAIGCNVIKIAKGFGMNVIGYKRSPDPELEKKFGFTIHDLETVLQKSDVVSLHLPYSQETHHIIDEEKFYMMKKGAVLINTARGALIDTRALIEALGRGDLAGVGLDVCEGEPVLREESQLLSKQFNSEEMMYVMEEHMLLHHPNVIITPHNAFNSREALTIILDTTVKNIEGFVSKKPENVVESRD
ncbi:MAG TPA: hydroxyacid dehydrogenase [Candidatus Levybacteria bacterium]|nr:hydroxyacid dehydrogenase [Candidatus Levybacteria bacterium]